MEYTEQQYLQSLERSLRLIRNGERLSLEASIEELCKLLLLQIVLERESQRTLNDFVGDMVLLDDDEVDYYHEIFKKYELDYIFSGWDYTKLSLNTLMRVTEELTHDSLFESRLEAKAKAFTEFLQLHYSGYLSEYSTPQALNKYIMDVVGPEQFYSLADPCCGLGGMIVEGINRSKHSLEVKGFDINQRMVNTANLHIMMYGYNGGYVQCLDFMEMAFAFHDGPYDAIVSHLPNKRRAYSIAGRKSDYQGRLFSNIPEDILISHVLKMLRVNGVAALVVSDDLLLSEYREKSRRWLYENAQILNITRFDGLTYNGGSNVRPYNVMFLRRLEEPASDVCSATLLKVGLEADEIEKVASNLKKVIYAESKDIPKNEHIRYFRLLNEENWNVNLLFAREKMGWRYPTCPLKELVIHDRERVKITDSRNYKQLTVRSRGLGVVDRKEEFIGDVSSNNIRYIAKSGQLIISSLEADRGAVGIVPKNLDGALVSRNYYLFKIVSQNIDPDYLVMVLSSEPVSKQLAFYKRGYVMARISIEKLMSLVIPVPSLAEQRQLVANLKKKVKQVQLVQNDLEREQKDFALKLFGEEENL